ncbi:MAG: hypothetical protein WCN97_03675 [Thermoleophilia bacterium]
MIAVSAGTRADTQAFVAQRFGAAPVDVYVDELHTIDRAFRVVTHPVFRFVTAGGALTKRAPAGFPFR